MGDHDDETLAGSPRDPVTGRVGPRPGPLDRAGTEAEAAEGEGGSPRSDAGTPAGQANAAFEGTAPSEPPGQGPGRDAERAAAYRENDA